MLNELSPWHLIIVLLIFALLFGAKRLPDAARGLGRSMRIFRSEMQAAKDEFTAEATAQPAPVTDTPPQLQDAVPPPAAAVTVEPAKPAVEH